MTPYYRNAVRALDPKLDLNDQSAYCAAMLLCAAKNGASDGDVIQRTGVPLAAGKAIAWRLRRNRVWRKTATHHSGWDDPESGGIAFWLDVNVGTGMMRRSYGPRSENTSGANDV